MRTYLVTGGAGFIGSHVVDRLVQSGATVRVVDDLSTGRRSNLAQHEVSAIEFVEADLAAPGVADRAVDGMDCVLHLAAMPSVLRSVRDPVTSHRANVDATLLLLEAARAARVQRFVFASSSSVYGDAATLPAREDMATRPRSPYALQKLVGEQYLTLFHVLYGLDTVALRFFNVYGPRQDPQSPYSGVIALFTTALLAGRPPTIDGDGEQTRDFTYVSDVASGVIASATALDIGGRIINLARGDRVSVNRIAAILRAEIGVDALPVHGPPREGDVRDSQADPALARTLLEFVPAVSIEEGLSRTVDWYRAARRARP